MALFTPSIGERILRKLAITKYRRSLRKPSEDRGETFESYFEWQFNSTQKLLSHLPANFSLAGKTVLEIGCGTGGRTAWLASQGTARIVGIDINREEIQLARELCRKLRPELADKVEYVVATEDESLDLGTFDTVTLLDTMEHVVHPPNMLRLCYKYTKSGGECYVCNMGWWHHGGSHLNELIPWVQVFFRDETICNTMRYLLSHPEYRPTRFDSNPPVDRWIGVYDLRDRPGEHLNKISIREMRRLASHSQFGSATVRVHGFSHPKLKPLNVLTNLPILEEFFHSTVSIVLKRFPEHDACIERTKGDESWEGL